MSLSKITAYIYKASKNVNAAKIKLSVTKITSARTKKFLKHCSAIPHSIIQTNTLHLSDYVDTHIINVKNKHSICWFMCFSCLLFGVLITGLYSTGITSLLELSISALSSPPTIPTYTIKTLWCSELNILVMGQGVLFFLTRVTVSA